MTPDRPARGSTREAGFTLLQAAIVMLVLASTAFAAFLATQRSELRGRFTTLRTQMESIEDALVRYVAVNQRLPCPASTDPVRTGLPTPNAATVACNVPGGTDGGIVPWVALGLSEEDVIDAWGRFITYRVYTGATGTTRAGGINMRDCNTDSTATSAPITDCDAGTPWPDHPDDFVRNKGLTVRDAPTGDFLNDPAAGSGAAFILISHGSNGRGAFLPGLNGPSDDAQRLAAPPGSSYEFPNSDLTVAADGSPIAGGTYIDAAFDDAVDTIGADTHFDGVLRTMTIRELAEQLEEAPC